MLHDGDGNRRLCDEMSTHKKHHQQKKGLKKRSFQSFTLETTLTVESVLVGIFALHSFLVGWPMHDDSNSSGVFPRRKNTPGPSRVGFVTGDNFGIFSTSMSFCEVLMEGRLGRLVTSSGWSNFYLLLLRILPKVWFFLLRPF